MLLTNRYSSNALSNAKRWKSQNQRLVVRTTGRWVLDAECACDERTVREQSRRRKMGILHHGHQSHGPHLSVLAHSAFKYDRATTVDNEHLERRAALAEFAWPDKPHHFMSQSAGNVLVAHRRDGSQGFVLNRFAESAASVLHLLTLPPCDAI